MTPEIAQQRILSGVVVLGRPPGKRGNLFGQTGGHIAGFFVGAIVAYGSGGVYRKPVFQLVLFYALDEISGLAGGDRINSEVVAGTADLDLTDQPGDHWPRSGMQIRTQTTQS